MMIRNTAPRLRARLASGLAKKGVKDELLDPAKES